MLMFATAEIEIAVQVAAVGLAGGLEAKSGGGGGHLGWVLRFVALSFLRHVLLLGNEVVDAFFELHLLTVTVYQ